jgi:hypothetical protein
MPVELPELEPSESAPGLPRVIVWLVLFVVVMVAAVVIGLLTWSKGEPTGTLWFWIRLIVLPALTWCVMFGLRLHYFDEETERLQAEREVRRQDRDKALLFASEPLAVLGCAYLVASGSTDVASKIAEGELTLHAGTSLAGISAVRHSALELKEDLEAPGRYRACFNSVLERIAGAVTAVPDKLPFSISLHLPSGEDQDELLNTWQSCWEEKNLRAVKATPLAVDQGLMAVDEWLDIRGGRSLERVTLFVSVQLHDDSPQMSAEAAVGVLLAWAPLAERNGLKAQALLHRPVETGKAGLHAALSTALLWGKTTAADVSDLWQAGLTGTDKTAFLQAASDMKLGVSETTGLSGVHDIDLAVGRSAVCAGWLAVALGIEHAVQTGTPQLMAWREGSLRLAVVHAPCA